jgi:hypothetical protein
VPSPGPDEPEIKTPAQIKKIRESCRLARFILGSVGKYIKARLTEMQNKDIILPLPKYKNADVSYSYRWAEQQMTLMLWFTA